MINIKNISHSFPLKVGSKKILENIDLSISDGEFVSVLGSSGCGKTTLVNILAGYLKPNFGEIFIDNRNVTKPGKNRIVVNQENDLFQWMTTEENMKLVSRNEKSINELLELVHLEDVKDFFPNKLSGGMKKRLSLVRAVVSDPDFLILDEPFSSLDQRMRDYLNSDLDKLFSRTKQTTLLVTHNIEEAIFLSDRIIILGGTPTSIIKTITINFAHPRESSIKNTQKFLIYKDKIKASYGN